MNTAYRITLPLLALVVATPAAAEEGAPDDNYSITVIGERIAIADSHASVSVIGPEEIERAQNGSAASLLERLPGVQLSQYGTLGGVTSLRIRGAEADNTLVVIDGVQVGDPSSVGGGFDFGNLMLGGIDRIEVMRGANSLIWGSKAMGGVVSISTIQPPADGEPATSGRASAEYGARDTVRVNGQLRTAVLGASQFGIGAGYVRTDGISSAAVGTERDGYRQVSVNLTNRTQIGDTLTLRAFGLYADSRVELDGFPAWTFDDTAEYQKTREHYAGASIEHRSGSGLSQRLSFGLADINRDNYDPAAGTAPLYGYRGRSERLSYSIDWSPASERVRLLAGAEREWTHMLASGDAQDTAVTSAWGLLRGDVTGGLSLTAGVRHDDHRDFGGATTLAFDLGQALGEIATLRASYREAFKAPSLYQLSDSPFGVGNPDLAPERARAYEIGLRVQPDAGWHLDVAVFRRDTRNLIDFVSCPAGPAPLPAICASGNRLWGTYDNVNLARAVGVEVDTAVRLAESLRLIANYSYVSTTDRTAASIYHGNRLARRPRHMANAELAWTVGKADVSAAVRYVGKSFDNRANTVPLDDYILADLRASVPILPGIDLFGRVENLFDAKYQTVAGYGTAGRSAYAGMRWGF